jgi:hypothetical protein
MTFARSRSRRGLASAGVSTTFEIFLVLHILSAIVAFAPAVVAVLPGGRDGAMGVIERAGRQVYVPAMILVGLFGILCIVTSDVGGTALFEFSDTWVSLAFVVWIAMNGVFHAIVIPAQRDADDDKFTNGQAILTVLFVAMLYLMVFKPGA